LRKRPELCPLFSGHLGDGRAAALDDIALVLFEAGDDTAGLNWSG